MSFAAVLFSLYLLVGLIFAFTVITKAKKMRSVPADEPALFWLYLLLWPIAALMSRGDASMPYPAPHRVQSNPGNATRSDEAFAQYRRAVIEAAERKLGRKLSETESLGVQRIGSMMMLESCHRSFASDLYEPSQVEKDLLYFARDDAKRQIA